MLPSSPSSAYPNLYTQNKTLSSGADELLAAQGASALARKMAKMGTTSVKIKHSAPADGVETIVLSQSLSGMLGKFEETRPLDWERRVSTSKLWGTGYYRTKRAALNEVEDEWLREGWVENVQKDGLILYSLEGEAKEGAWSLHIVSVP